MSVSILIADDEPNQLELLSFNLSKAGFVVHKASDGKQASEMIDTLHPDLVILDWMMPEMSGIDLCKMIRKTDHLKNLPIIILSARGEEGDKTFGLDVGADDYVTKPFSPRELIARIKAVLRRRSPSSAGAVQSVGDLVVDHEQMTVKRANIVISLGPKEFKILSILMERPGQVFSRTQILDRVWGHGIYVEDRTVDVHLSRLRKALRTDDGKQAEALRTVRGVGYALNVKN
ncbi:MAG: response regulator [Candidatus Puniceispirillaceae bacterium]